jgi:hypothetical protein
MFTSTNTARGFKALAVGVVAALALFVGSIAHGEVNAPIFLTRLANVIKTYPATAQLVVGGAFTEGGTTYATSTTGNVVPLIASNFDEETSIDVTLGVVDATLSFPASSTLASNFLPTSGMKRSLYIRNASTTATMDLTVTGGTGILLKRATTSSVIYGDTDGANYGRIDLVRKANTDIEALLTIFVD